MGHLFKHGEHVRILSLGVTATVKTTATDPLAPVALVRHGAHNIADLKLLHPGDFGYTGKQPVNAEVHTEGRPNLVEFDAGAWFEQASDQGVLDLAHVGWGHDLSADHVAEFFIGKHPVITDLLANDETAFECNIDVEDAKAWVAENSPHLLVHLPV